LDSIGLVRRLDPLGRIVLPIELRQTMHIGNEAPMEFFVDGEMIILRKYEPECVFCGSGEGVSDFRGRNVCLKCVHELYGQLADAKE